MYGLNIVTSLWRLWNDESGIASVEYVLLLAFVVSGILAAAEPLANAMQNEINETPTCTEYDLGC